jgi:hypothetical protein
MKMLLIQFTLIILADMKFLEEFQSAQIIVSDDYVKCFWIKGFNLFNINGLTRKSKAKEYI